MYKKTIFQNVESIILYQYLTVSQHTQLELLPFYDFYFFLDLIEVCDVARL